MSTAAERIAKAEEFIKECGKEIDIDIVYYVDWDEEEPDDWSNCYDEIERLLDDNSAFDIDVIYYSAAIEYLANNDPSLTESLSIAEECGFSVGSLSSEILASLLKSQKAREDWSNLRESFERFFAELQEEKEEEEEEEEEEANEI